MKKLSEFSNDELLIIVTYLQDLVYINAEADEKRRKYINIVKAQINKRCIELGKIDFYN